jgi:uncharacterized surface protein with fasciclin (FAS1) repeats
MTKFNRALCAALAAGLALPVAAQTTTAPTTAPDAAPAAQPQTGAASAPTAAEAASPVASQSVADVVMADPQFSTLAKAVTAAGIGDALKSGTAVTLFAPTDAAFAKLPAGKLDELLQPANKAQLQALLGYHVVTGYAPAQAFAGKRGSLTASAGGTLVADGTAGSVKVNDATVTKADIKAANGVVHAIDTVLMPKAG